MSDPRRGLPSVASVIALPEFAALLDRFPRTQVIDALRDTLADRRERRAGSDGLADDVTARLTPSLRRVINATGVVLHTNLGRAPLAEEAIAAAVAVSGYGTLEWDPVTGERGSRHDHIVAHLQALTGAEAACVANTNAGAVLLALVALASGNDVIVSRGQLVEIGGGFRIPEVLTASGCRLVEVGTTNKTRVSDYEHAVGPNAAAILRVHPSNFRVVGFTEEAPLDGLVAVAHRHDLVVIDDLGSGALTDDAIYRDEPDVRTSVAAGVDVAAFSGDKLLGGPQCGILVGTAEAIDRCRAHPLMRALRCDKLTLAALEATLALHRDPAHASARIPGLAMLSADPHDLQARANLLADQLAGEVVPSIGRVGGGALPLAELPSFAVSLPTPHGPDALAACLRGLSTPVVARVTEGRLLLDVLTLTDRDVAELPHLLEEAT